MKLLRKLLIKKTANNFSHKLHLDRINQDNQDLYKIRKERSELIKTILRSKKKYFLVF